LDSQGQIVSVAAMVADAVCNSRICRLGGTLFAIQLRTLGDTTPSMKHSVHLTRLDEKAESAERWELSVSSQPYERAKEVR